MLKSLLQKSSRKKLSTGEEKKDTITVDERAIPMDLVSQAPSVCGKRTRRSFNSIDKTVGQRRKRSAEDLNKLDRRVESRDLISQLPEHIIHHILSLLRDAKDAARTSCLSRRWRQMWTSFSILKYDQDKIQEQEGCLDMSNKQMMFKDFVDNSLKSHLEQKLSIQKLVLHITAYDFTLARHMNRWINVAIKNNMKELDVNVVVKERKHYSLPRTVFAAKSITGLRLHGCKLRSCSDIKLPQLQKLYLRKVRVDQQTIENLISSCPLIEDLRFIYCTGLKDLKVSSLLKLDRVEVHHCHVLTEIIVKAPNLQTFWYRGEKSMPCKVDLVACVSLKRLTLEDANMTDGMFQDQFASLPLLEKLDLSKCNNLKNITISSIRLKKLVLRECKNLMEADIDAPNLFSFVFKGDKMPFSFSNPLSLNEAQFSFGPVHMDSREFRLGDEDALWFARLRELLEKLKHSNDLKLVVRSNKNVIIHENLEEILLPPQSDLKLEIIKPSTGFEKLLDNLLRTSHPEILSIVSSSNSEFPKLVHEKIMHRGENPNCCPYNTQNKCWRHSLKGFKIENFEAAAGKRTSNWIAWLRSSRTVLYQTTSYRLSWDFNEHGRKPKRILC
ncbi:putative F-box/FBD/LRR-repeat protein At1g66290 [Fagus crenata]